MHKTLEEYILEYGPELGQSLFDFINAPSIYTKKSSLATIMAKLFQEGSFKNRTEVFMAILDCIETLSAPR